jgi:Asp-tRNA(Asn)/Glu-tRNA(Gln) amidotransferase A subunit family amidase
VGDVRLGFKVLSKTPDTAQRNPDWSRVRVAWYSNDGVSPVTTETRVAVQAAADVLKGAGASVKEERPPAVEKALDVWLRLFSRASVVLLRQVYAGNDDKAGSFVRWRLATADDKPVESLDEYILGWLDRDRLRLQVLDWMKRTPLVIAPVGAVPALEHDVLKAVVNGESISAFRAFSYAQAFNAFDLPAITVPAGRSPEGLPIGVQVAGRPEDEHLIFAAAELVEQALGGWQGPAAHKSEPPAVAGG